MRILILLLFLPSISTLGSPWPHLSNPKIASGDHSSQGPYSRNVSYSHSGTVLLDVQPVYTPYTNSSPIEAYGVHCQSGSKYPGYERPFSSCTWDKSSGQHSPKMTGKCQTIAGSWRLTPDSNCSTSYSWGNHSGAGPGGECVMFGIYYSPATIATPMGAINATTAANSGNAFCQKPLPPNITCDISLTDSVLDHGLMTTTGSHTTSVSGEISCGEAPIVEIVGGNDISLGNGVSTKLDIKTLGSKQIVIYSNMTTVNAEAGDYIASRVVTVSPW